MWSNIFESSLYQASKHTIMFCILLFVAVKQPRKWHNINLIATYDVLLSPVLHGQQHYGASDKYISHRNNILLDWYLGLKPLSRGLLHSSLF